MEGGGGKLVAVGDGRGSGKVEGEARVVGSGAVGVERSLLGEEGGTVTLNDGSDGRLLSKVRICRCRGGSRFRAASSELRAALRGGRRRVVGDAGHSKRELVQHGTASVRAARTRQRLRSDDEDAFPPRSLGSSSSLRRRNSHELRRHGCWARRELGLNDGLDVLDTDENL